MSYSTCFAFNHKIFSVGNMIYIFFKIEEISIYEHYICSGGKLEQLKPSLNAVAAQPL